MARRPDIASGYQGAVDTLALEDGDGVRKRGESSPAGARAYIIEEDLV
jgi:hypothetical protein